MQDRTPTKPNRVLIRPEDGSPAFYATMTRADEPTQPGDPLNKTTFLKDATAALFGLDETAVPDDVFQLIPLLFKNIQTDVSGIPRTATQAGTYVGDDNYTYSTYKNSVWGLGGTKKSLSLPFKPKLLIVSYNDRHIGTGVGTTTIMLWQEGIESETISTGTVIGPTCRKYEVKDETITWWITNDPDGTVDPDYHRELMFNRSDTTYTYFAVGILEV